MSKKTDPRTTAKRLVAQAVGKQDTNASEARNFAMKACKLIAEHELLDAGISVPMPSAEKIGAAVDRGRGFVKDVKETAADPNVQKVVGAAADILQGLNGILNRRKRG